MRYEADRDAHLERVRYGVVAANLPECNGREKPREIQLYKHGTCPVRGPNRIHREYKWDVLIQLARLEIRSRGFRVGVCGSSSGAHDLDYP
jgi:hypothetical protein